ncbi:MAG: polysaccharide biosynthesis/export family protein [bacterium]
MMLRPGLLINIRVLVDGQKEVEESTKRIQNDGLIALPLVGQVQAGGRTLPEFRDELFRLYNSAYFVNPQVIVEIAAEQGDEGLFPWGYVTVLGRVKQPGRVRIPPTKDITVSRAIQLVGGFDTSAKTTSIKVTRGKDGQQELFSVDLKDVGARGNVKADIVLMPNDIVYVPEEIF